MANRYGILLAQYEGEIRPHGSCLARFALRAARDNPIAISLVCCVAGARGGRRTERRSVDTSWLRSPVEKDPPSFMQAIPSYSGWFATENQFHGFTVKDYEAIRNRAKTLREVAAFSGAGGGKLDDDSEDIGLGLVTCNFFDVYAWRLVKGRLFLPQECSTPGAEPVVAISEGQLVPARFLPSIFGLVRYFGGFPVNQT